MVFTCLMFFILDRYGGNSALMRSIYHNGKVLGWIQLVMNPLNLSIGVVYYICLFGRSCARNERVYWWCSPVLSFLNILIGITLPVSWCFLFNSLIIFLINVGLPDSIPTSPGNVSAMFASSNHIFTQPRVERVLHSMLSSRVLLQIRAQVGDNVVLSDGQNWAQTAFQVHDSSKTWFSSWAKSLDIEKVVSSAYAFSTAKKTVKYLLISILRWMILTVIQLNRNANELPLLAPWFLPWLQPRFA